MRFLILLLVLSISMACSDGANTSKSNISSGSPSPTKGCPLPVCGYEIVNSYPHDPNAFTEGLFFHDGYLYESTGGREAGASTLRKVELTSGKVVQQWTL